MAEDRTTRCAHQDCTCHTQDGAEFCSESCQTASQAGTSANAHARCGCGHAACVASQYREAKPARSAREDARRSSH